MKYGKYKNENDYLNAEKMYATKLHNALKANDIASVKSIGQEIIQALPYTYRDIFDEVIRDTDSELAKKLQSMDYVAFMHDLEDDSKLYDKDNRRNKMAGKYSRLFKPYVAYGKNDKGFYDLTADESLKYFDDKVPEGEEWEALKDMGINLNLPSTWHEMDTYFLTDNVLPFVTPDKKDWGKDTWFDKDKRRIANNIWHDFDNHNGAFSAEDFEKNGITPEARRNIFKRLVLDARNNANHLNDYENREDKNEDFLNYGTGMRLSIGDALEHKKYLDSLTDDDGEPEIEQDDYAQGFADVQNSEDPTAPAGKSNSYYDGWNDGLFEKSNTKVGGIAKALTANDLGRSL